MEIRCAPLPRPLGVVALHHWFVVEDGGAVPGIRWEVWQDPDVGGVSWGHVHRDLMHPDSEVGGGPGWLAASCTGDAARRIRAVLEEPERYPTGAAIMPGPARTATPTPPGYCARPA